MIIVEDTRNQLNKHQAKRDWFEDHDITVVRSKLYCGDYSRLDNQTICIDTKKNWLELAGNICGKQHERFRNECVRAKTAQIRLIILVEELTPIEYWKSPLNRQNKAISKVDINVLKKAMQTMSEKYGVEFRHCDKKDTAKTIYKILKG